MLLTLANKYGDVGDITTVESIRPAASVWLGELFMLLSSTVQMLG